MPKKPKDQAPALLAITSLEHLRYQLTCGVSVKDWDDEALDRLIREHIQLQEGHGAVLGLPDHPMRKACKEASRRALGQS